MFVVSKIQFANVRLGKKKNGEQVGYNAGNKSIGALSQFGNSG